jgi:hypothetical protein
VKLDWRSNLWIADVLQIAAILTDIAAVLAAPIVCTFILTFSCVRGGRGGYGLRIYVAGMDNDTLDPSSYYLGWQDFFRICELSALAS